MALPAVDIGLCFDQEADSLFVSVLRCQHQRCVAVRITYIQIRFMSYQNFDHLSPAFL